MKAILITLFISGLLSILFGCNSNKEYYQTFKGASNNWSVELVEDGKVSFKDHKEFENQYEIEFERNQHLKLSYIGDETHLGSTVTYSYDYGNGETNASNGKVIGVNESFTHSGGSGGISHIPKDLEYRPVSDKDRIFTVMVKWRGKEEKIKLEVKD